MESTLATVIIAAADQATAQVDFPEYFNASVSPDGKLTIKNYLTNKYFDDNELDNIGNNVTWPRKVYFGTLEVGLQKSGLFSTVGRHANISVINTVSGDFIPAGNLGV